MNACAYETLNSSFEGNDATNLGGAIFFSEFQPTGWETNTFIDNYAPYGSDIASYPFTIRLIQITQNISTSGDVFPGIIQVEVLDTQLQRITNDDTS